MSRKENLKYIDALRGLAILGVLCVHFTLFGKGVTGFEYLPFHLDVLFYEGRYGVALFFVVSAFTLARSLEGRVKTENMAIRKYFIRRIFRIAPAFYTVILLVFFIKGVGVPGYVDPSSPQLTWVDLLTHLTFTNVLFPYYINDFIGVEWSIATEFAFYMLLPLLMYPLLSGIKSSTKFLIITIFFVGAIGLYGGIIFGGALTLMYSNVESAVFSAWRYFFIGSHLHVFLVGILVWLFLANIKVHDYVSKRVAFVCLFVCLLQYFSRTSKVDT